jgi:hypothetical protein
METAGAVPVIEPRLADQLELHGIGVSVVSSPSEGLFGANFVVTTSGREHQQSTESLRSDLLAHGTVLVNATGNDLPEPLVNQMDEIYVDDVGLLEAHRDRRVAAMYLDSTSESGGPRLSGDLAELLAGQSPNRQEPNDNVLVELLGAHDLNARLAHRVCDGALDTGLGVRIAT